MRRWFAGPAGFRHSSAGVARHRFHHREELGEILGEASEFAPRAEPRYPRRTKDTSETAATSSIPKTLCKAARHRDHLEQGPWKFRCSKTFPNVPVSSLPTTWRGPFHPSHTSIKPRRDHAIVVGVQVLSICLQARSLRANLLAECCWFPTKDGQVAIFEKFGSCQTCQ